jgi:ribosomal protein S18 acetylase RimI-like enzyme
MITKLDLSVRQASIEDKQRLANLIHFETRVHRHLDWRPPLEWIGSEPFLVVEENNRFIAALACPPDPPDVAWMRLFAVKEGTDIGETWSQLWSHALEIISKNNNVQVAAIPLQPWFQRLLKKSGFREISQVVMMIWDSGYIPPPQPSPDISIRPMNIDDLHQVEVLDKISFGSLWHNSKKSLEYAFRQAAIASTAVLEDEIVAYQISTSMQMGGHLARLATHPDFQRQGIGSALLRDLLIQFKQRGAVRITVNTQQENLTSISLYEKAGFTPTGEIYPVYQYHPE